MKFYCDVITRSRLQLINTPSLVNLMTFLRRPMIVKRELDGAVDESSVIKRFVNRMQLYISWEKSGGLYLMELGLTTGRLADKI